MKLTLHQATLTLDFLSVLGACDEGIEFAKRNGLIGISVQRLIDCYRRIDKKYHHSVPFIHWFYCNVSPISEITFDESGRIIEIRHHDRIITSRRYNSDDKLCFIGHNNRGDCHIEYDGDYVHYKYPRRMITKIGDIVVGLVNNGCKEIIHEYDNNGRLVVTSYSKSIDVYDNHNHIMSQSGDTITLYENGFVVSCKHKDVDIMNYELKYDGDALVSYITTSIGGSQRIVYDYDESGRETRVSRYKYGTLYSMTETTYDNIGNVTNTMDHAYGQLMRRTESLLINHENGVMISLLLTTDNNEILITI